jgi:hypothetical protein
MLKTLKNYAKVCKNLAKVCKNTAKVCKYAKSFLKFQKLTFDDLSQPQMTFLTKMNGIVINRVFLFA